MRALNKLPGGDPAPWLLLSCALVIGVFSEPGTPGAIHHAWWPAAGLVASGLVVTSPPLRLRFTIVAAVVLSVIHLLGRESLVVGLGIALATLAAAVVTTQVFAPNDSARLDDARGLLRLGTAAAMGATAAAVIVLLVERGSWQHHFQASAATWWSHFTATVLILPLLLETPPQPAVQRRIPEFAAQSAVLAISMAVAFSPQTQVSLAWLPWPALIWAGLRLGHRVMLLEVLAVATWAIYATHQGWGPFAGFLSGWPSALVLVDFFAATLALTLMTTNLEWQRLRSRHEHDSAALVMARYRTRVAVELLDEASDLMVVALPDGTIVAVNARTSALTGQSQNDMRGKSLWAALTPSEAPETGRHRFRRLIDTSRSSVPVEISVETSDGSLRRLLTRAVLSEGDPSGLPDRYVIVGVDVTRDRNASSVVSQFLRAPISTAIVATDQNGIITTFNKGAEDLTGELVDDALGQSFAPFLVRRVQSSTDRSDSRVERDPSDTPITWASVVGPTLRSERPETTDWLWRVNKENGEEATILASTTVSELRDAYGKLTGFLFVAEDVTSVRASQDQWRRLDQARNEFVWTASHEIRTPMTSIIGYAELLEDGAFGHLTDEQGRIVSAITRNGLRLRALAEDLLRLTRFDEASEDASYDEEILVADLLGAAVDSGLGTAIAQNIVLESRILDPGLRVWGDRTALDRVLFNLVGNAIKFTPRGRIDLIGRRDHDNAVIEVRDTGVGIPADQLEGVFQRFFRARTAADIPGTGLGLSIASQTMIRHGGDITVRSVEGEGTTFTLRLPLASARESVNPD